MFVIIDGLIVLGNIVVFFIFSNSIKLSSINLFISSRGIFPNLISLRIVAFLRGWIIFIYSPKKGEIF
jgi:L-asparagine transporter-like permease